jgi:hypothetical protein
MHVSQSAILPDSNAVRKRLVAEKAMQYHGKNVKFGIYTTFKSLDSRA